MGRKWRGLISFVRLSRISFVQVRASAQKKVMSAQDVMLDQEKVMLVQEEVMLAQGGAKSKARTK